MLFRFCNGFFLIIIKTIEAELIQEIVIIIVNYSASLELHFDSNEFL